MEAYIVARLKLDRQLQRQQCGGCIINSSNKSWLRHMFSWGNGFCC